MRMLSKLFPTFGIKNIFIHYLLGIFLNGWFILPNWVFLYSMYLTRKEVGIVEGVAILVGILMEVPSGVFADILGKKKSIILGSFLLIVSCLTLINAHNFMGFLVGNIVMFMGFSFHSGATEAFAYDSLVEKNQNEYYDVVTSKHTAIGIATTVFSTFFGGFLFSIHPTYPFFAWILFLGISIILMFLSTEPSIDTVKFSVKNYLIHLREGVQGLFGKSLRDYLIPILTLTGLMRLYQGLVRQSMAQYFGYTGETFGYLLAAILIPGALLSYKFDALRKWFGERKLLIASISTYAMAFLIALLSQNVIVGGTVFFIIMITERVAEPLVSVLINHRIDSKHRATILSTKALVAYIPYVVMVLFFANITLAQNLHFLYISYVVLMVITLGYVWKGIAHVKATGKHTD